MISLFDLKWHKKSPADYADFMQSSGITDVIPVVYSQWGNLDITVFAKENRARGIRVHACFHVAEVNEDRQNVDIHSPDFQQWIANYITRYVLEHDIDGVCLDYIRSDYSSDPADMDANLESIENIVALISQQVSSVSDVIISSTTEVRPEPNANGWNATKWANDGYMDLLFDMNYGSPGGNPPDMNRVYSSRMKTDTPIHIMAACFHKESGVTLPLPRDEFIPIMDALKYEKDFALFSGYQFNQDHADLLG